MHATLDKHERTGLPYWTLHVTREEVAHTVWNDNGFYVTALTPEALEAALVVAGPDTEGHSAYARPGVLIPEEPPPWAPDRKPIPHALDYEQWRALRGAE